MTTVSMIAGMSPIALALDPGSERAPRARHRRDRRPHELAAAHAAARARRIRLVRADWRRRTEMALRIKKLLLPRLQQRRAEFARKLKEEQHAPVFRKPDWRGRPRSGRFWRSLERSRPT